MQHQGFKLITSRLHQCEEYEMPFFPECVVLVWTSRHSRQEMQTKGVPVRMRFHSIHKESPQSVTPRRRQTELSSFHSVCVEKPVCAHKRISWPPTGKPGGAASSGIERRSFSLMTLTKSSLVPTLHELTVHERFP